MPFAMGWRTKSPIVVNEGDEPRIYEGATSATEFRETVENWIVVMDEMYPAFHHWVREMTDEEAMEHSRNFQFNLENREELLARSVGRAPGYS